MSTIQRTDQDIQRELEDVIARAGVPLAVTVENGVVKVEGVVLSEEEREAVVDLLRLIPGVRDVEDSLIVVEELEGEEPDVLYGMLTHPEDPDLLPGEVVEDEDSGIPDKITTYDPGKVVDDWTTDERVAVQEAMPYFPPTDPAIDIAADRPENIQVTTGFQATAMDDDEAYWDENVDEDGIVRDAALVDAVVRELNEDSSTTHLNIHVASVRGVVVLTGFVSSQTDADLAEAVADRVPGVRFVADRLIVSDCPPEELRPQIRRRSGRRRGEVGVPSLAWRATVARNEQWLQAERDRIQERIAGRRAELVSVARDQSEEGGISNHEGDIGSEVATAEVLNAEIVRMEDELEAIHEALQMIRDGRYGICLRCGELIDPPRLRAYPLALRHARCQEEFELEIIPPAPRRSEI